MAELDELGMQPEDAHFEHGVLARGFDLLIDLFGDLFHRLLDAGGVDAAVRNEALEREAGDLPSDGIEARKDDDFGRIVDDEFDAGRVLDGADVAPLAADDARLHVVVGQRHDGDRRLRSVIGCAALDGERDDVLGVEVRLVLCLLFEVPHLHRAVAAGLVQNFVGELRLRFLFGELGDALELLHHEFMLMRELFPRLFHLFEAVIQIVLLLFDAVELLGKFLIFPLERVFLLVEARFDALLLGALLLHFLLKLVSSFEFLLLGLEDRFFF